MGNGMTVPSNDDRLTMSQRDVDILTAGAPMSPTANNLLPSNLLRDDDLSASVFDTIADQGDEGGINSHNLHSYMGSGVDGSNQDPQSPMSIDSRSPSLVSSPHESIHNLHGYHPSRDPLTDSDRHSTHSAGSPFAPPGINIGANAVNGRRLTHLFNFNRQRGKSTVSEAPSLGTLKQGQSQSFPRNYDQEPLEPLISGRRRIGSGNWTNPMSTFLARNNVGSSSGADGDSASNPRFAFTRKNRLHMFGSKLEPSDQLGLHRSSSPRPSSTYSFENALPRPSSESQPFGWASADSAHQRSSPLVVDWSSLGGPWSRNQSRRASVQQGSTSNLSIGSTPLDPDDYSSPYGNKISPPAPIGTGRGKAGRTGAPKLNPAAPSFTTRLFSRNDTKKGSKGDKNGEKSGDNTKGKDVDKSDRSKDVDSDYLPDESSPPNSRLSKDGHSIATATSFGDSYEPLDHSNSATPSDSVTTSAPKESLMQRITRKSSSSKFNVPWSKDRTGSLFSKKTGEPSTPGELDEDGASDFLLGKGTETAASTPQHEKGGRASLTWSRVMSRKSKKGEKEASESSEKASETETGDDDEP